MFRNLAISGGDLPLGRRINFVLRPVSALRFVVKPGREPKTGSFAGLAPFSVAKDGLYRVSASAPVWLEVADAAKGQAVNSAKFEMQPR